MTHTASTLLAIAILAAVGSSVRAEEATAPADAAVPEGTLPSSPEASDPSPLESMAGGLDAVGDRLREHRPGTGFDVAETEWGSLNIRLFFYLRYLNQLGLDESYTDSFGTVRPVDRRNDIFFNKVNIYFSGWLLDPKFKYLLFLWTANTSQGLGAQVVLAGFVGYEFDRHFRLYGGVNSLPTTRTTMNNFPNWHSVDARAIADEYFRGSFTIGIWANGDLFGDFDYWVMLGNNLAALGVDAGQLNDGLDTFSAALVWEPTGAFGNSLDDFDESEHAVTRLAGHFTRSHEDLQSQPGQNDIENSQIRIADGNRIWDPDLFGPGIQILDAYYQMVAVDTGVKYRGLSVMGEYYFRWVDGLSGTGVAGLPFTEFKDHGFQLQASYMVMPKLLQLYTIGAMVLGEYGQPWEVRGGVNWFFFKNRGLRWNFELIYVDRSPSGALALPYVVGGTGVIFHSNVEVNF